MSETTVSQPICEWDSRLGSQINGWSRDNLSELLPGILKPLAASWLLHMDYFAEREWIGWAGAFDLFPIEPPPESSFFGVFGGRAYINWGWCAAAASVWQVERSGFSDKWARALDFSSQVIDPERAAATSKRLFRSWRHLPERINAEQRVLEGLRREVQARTGAGERGLFRLLRRLVRAAGRAFGSHQISTSATAQHLDLIEHLLDRAWPEHRKDISSLLVAAAGDVESSAPGHSLWDLSREVQARPRLRQQLTEGDLSAARAALTHPPDRDWVWFAERLGQVVERFWYRGEAELNLWEQDWSEDPTFVLSVVKSYIGATEDPAPRESERRAAAARQMLENEVMARLAPDDRRPLRRLLSHGREYVRLQELTKANWARGHRLGRYAALALGQRLFERGAIESPDDVFFLTFEDIDGATRARRASSEWREVVARRERAYRELFELELPFSFQSVPEIKHKTPQEVKPSQSYKGLGVSGGVAEGRARRVFSAKAAAEVELRPGEVLVAPYADAAWTPLFLSAAALVTERGSILSHASIVAREYGVPAVAGITNATELIPDGTLLRVDGTTGVVTVLD